MERLTFDGNFCEIAQCRELPCQYGGSCSQRKVWERLKEYEDTGLAPNVCANYKKFEDEAISNDVTRTLTDWYAGMGSARTASCGGTSSAGRTTGFARNTKLEVNG